MIIRKEYKFEGAHIVRGCTSERCKKSIHGHSYVVEVFLEGSKLDNGQMIYDFGLMKSTIHELIDSFDHAYSMWDVESVEFKQFIKGNSDRWIEMPVSPSAECYSLILLAMVDRIMQNTTPANGESDDVRVRSVRVHETRTGYAESFREDLKMLPENAVERMVFSEGIIADWKHLKADWSHKYQNPTVL